MNYRRAVPIGSGLPTGTRGWPSLSKGSGFEKLREGPEPGPFFVPTIY